jgi:uncharacterized protein YcfJ
MTFTKAMLALACLMPGTLVAQAAKVTPLFSKDLTNLPRKEGLMVTVEYHRAVRTQSIATTHMGFLCAGRVDRDAGERWKGNDSTTWSNLL